MKRWPLLFAVVGLVGSCVGPITYLNTTVRQARKAVAEARAAGAEKGAPYDYWCAVEYYQMANEKAGHADYQDAWKYGEKAIAHAEKAKQRLGGSRPSHPDDTHAREETE